MKRFFRLKLTARVCTLAILAAALFYAWSGTNVRADSNTTCIQCDTNYFNNRQDCNANYSNAQQACFQALNGCQNSGGTDCSTQYDNCLNAASSSTYDNCTTGFTDFTGLCSVVYGTPNPPPSGRGRTPCDFACRDDLFECLQNGGDTCGQEYNDCKLTCG